MATRHAPRRGAALALIAIFVAACGAQATPSNPLTGAPIAPASNLPATSGTIPVPSAPVIDAADLAGSMAAAEVGMRREDRERAGLADLGPGALELAAAMDLSAGRALTQARADAAGPDGALRGHIAAVGPVAAPEPGFNSMIVWAWLITSLGDLARDPKSGTVEGEPETVEIDGNVGTITTTVALNATVAGSRLSVDITIKTKGQVVDKSTGAILYGIDSIASGHIDVEFCPDANGQAVANVKLTSSEIYTRSGGTAKGISKDFSGTATISVDDQARIRTVEGTSQGSEESRGGIAQPGGGESTLAASTRTAGGDIANDGDGQRLPGADRAPGITLGGEGSTVDQQGSFWGSMTLFVETMVTAAAKEAEKLWREGKCVELIVDPEGGEVSPGEVRSVTAKLRHKVDGSELDKPVEAALTGVQSLEPAGGSQPAPATVTYTAGPTQGDVGQIAFKSVSNRGIAEKTVAFTVGGESLDVSLKGTMTTSLGGLSFSTTIDAPSIVLRRQADGTYAGSGPATIGILLDTAICPVPFSEKGTLKLIATREVPTDPALPGNWTVRYDPTGQVSFTGACYPDGVEVPLDGFTGTDGPTAGFMFVLGDVEFDPQGGTKRIKLNRPVGPASNEIDATMTAEIIRGS